MPGNREPLTIASSDPEVYDESHTRGETDSKL